MADRVFDRFLEHQLHAGQELARSSDLLDLLPLPGDPPDHYIAMFHCRGLVWNRDSSIAEAGHFKVGIAFCPDYLRKAVVSQLLTLLEPPNTFHPNIRFPFICIGRVSPGTPLVDLLYQVFEVITYHKVTMREGDALNRAACVWARKHKDRFPIDSRPLKRRAIPIDVEMPTAGGEA